MPLLFWAGGTYARRPEDFPQEQLSAAWLEKFLLPLNMKKPGFKWHESLQDFAKTWSSAKWHGKAPHPYAIREPFPYASASMRQYCVPGGWYWRGAGGTYYENAEKVPRDFPWYFFSAETAQQC